MRGMCLSQSLALSIRVPGKIPNGMRPGVCCGGALWALRRSPGQEEVGCSADPEEGVQPEAPRLRDWRGGGCVPAHPGECFSAMGGEGDVSFVRGAAAYMPGPGLSKSHEKGPPGQRGDPA